MCEFKQVQQASNWLKQGKLLAYPTESIWGLGCDAMNEQAVQQVLQIKKRPINKGMIVLTDHITRLEPLLMHLNQQQQHIIHNSWQNADTTTASQHPPQSTKQATTWLLPIPSDINIPHWITGQHQCIAVRVIAHPLIQQLCQSLVSETNPFGFLISSSCNFSEHKPASNLHEAKAYFAQHDNVGYLQGETLGYSLPSQIKDSQTFDILR